MLYCTLWCAVAVPQSYLRKILSTSLYSVQFHDLCTFVILCLFLFCYLCFRLFAFHVMFFSLYYCNALDCESPIN